MNALRVERRSVMLKVTRSDPPAVRVEHKAGARISLIRSGLAPIVAGGTEQVDIINPVFDGQIVFALSRMPANAQLIRMIVNGTRYRPPAFFINGQTATWNHQFTITSSDEIEFSYPI